jgi:hypothetical protein
MFYIFQFETKKKQIVDILLLTFNTQALVLLNEKNLTKK